MDSQTGHSARNGWVPRLLAEPCLFYHPAGIESPIRSWMIGYRYLVSIQQWPICLTSADYPRNTYIFHAKMQLIKNLSKKTNI